MKHDLDKILQAFTDFAALQIVAQVIRKLDENGVSKKEFHEWINGKGKRIVPSATRQKNFPWADLPRIKVIRKCPQCGKLLSLSEVNTTPDLQVGGDFQSQWYCGGTCKGCKKELRLEGCGWEEFSTKSFLEEGFPYMVRF